jgi:hypothetical protein
LALTITPGGDADDAYISLVAYKAYCAAHGYTFPSDTGDDDVIEQGIRRATQWIDAEYGRRFIGTPATVTQALEWPRADAIWRGEEIDNEIIPTKVANATAEAARREIATPGSLAPDMKRGGLIKRVAAGSAEVEFIDNAPAETAFSIIDGILAGLISSKSPGLSGSSVRSS